MRRDVFQAIADPTRRKIIALIAAQSMNLNAVAENFDMSRPAISKHMKILSECELVEITNKGRERFCQARIDKLDEVVAWIEPLKEIWNHRFDNLEKYIETLKEKSSKSK